MKENLKSYSIVLGKTYLIIFVGIFIVTLLNYFNIINKFTLELLKLLTPMIAFMYGGIKIGKQSQNKGYIAGIKFGIMAVMVNLILNLIFIREFNNIQYLLYIIILIAISMLGGMIGINKKKKD